MKLARLRDSGSVAGADRAAQALGFLSKMLEGWIVRQRTRRHSDLLARESGLAACGPQHQARKRLLLDLDETGGLGPFRGLGAPRALDSMLPDLSRAELHDGVQVGATGRVDDNQVFSLHAKY
jgi:hypothetical protein